MAAPRAIAIALPALVLLLLLVLAAAAAATAALAAPDEPKAPPKTCEEPDFAFLTGGPNTQGKFVPQWIFANFLGVDRDHEDGATVHRRTLLSTLRTEFGITDELEADAIVGYALAWERAGETPTEAIDGALDTILGARYRFLTQEKHWITFTAGPQLLLPTGDEKKGLSTGEVGWAIDAAASHDFGRLFFYAQINWAEWRDVDPPGVDRRFNLGKLYYSFALAGKLVEHWDEGYLHDVHAFLELAGSLEDVVAPDPVTGRPHRENVESFVFAPGIRYGYTTPKSRLFEIGISVPIGLDHDADDWGLILQIQYEHPF